METAGGFVVFFIRKQRTRHYSAVRRCCIRCGALILEMSDVFVDAEVDFQTRVDYLCISGLGFVEKKKWVINIRMYSCSISYFVLIK